MLEKLIAYHCGPALAGIKPANIVSCYKVSVPNLSGEIKKLNNQLNKKDIYIEVLCECDKRMLLMVYRKKILEKHLQNVEYAEFLQSFGYPKNASLDMYFSFLKIRLKEGEFPHEIGVFLGYPMHDIRGFINHPNVGCLLIGEWKVYKNRESAEKLFNRYRACRKALMRRLSNGFTLAQIFCAA